MVIALSIVFFIVLIIFMPIKSKVRLYISDYKKSFAVAIKIGRFIPQIIAKIKDGKAIVSSEVDKYKIKRVKLEDLIIDLPYNEVKNILRYIPLNFCNVLLGFGYKNNAMTTALILRSADMILSVIENTSLFPKHKFNKKIVPIYNIDRLYIEIEIGFSFTIFVIFYALFKILRARSRK